MCILREGSCVPEQKWKPRAGIPSTAGALSKGDWTIPHFRHALSTYRERVLVFFWDNSMRSPLDFTTVTVIGLKQRHSLLTDHL